MRPTDVNSPQRRFARKTWGSLGVERECAVAEAIAELHPDGIPERPDLDAIEQAAERRLSPLLGTAELAVRLGLSQSAVSQRLRRGALPPPDARLAMGPVWREETIAAWEQERSTY